MRTETKLIKALRSNDKTKITNIFEEIYNDYAKLVYFCIAKYVYNKQDIEELTNDIFVKFFNHLENIDESKNIKYYLLTSAKNAAIDFLRKKDFEFIHVDEIETYTENHQSTIPVYQQLIDDMKEVLTQKEIKIILDHQIYGLQLREIADIMCISTNTVKSIYRRALKKLQKYAKEV